ncbi:MAG: CvpA family protein [Chitinophagales bacterium]|nr:CvpA family protein [Chitinophagales bacterium]
MYFYDMFIDIFFILFLGVGFWWGYSKGIIYSIFSLVSYFLGIIAALKFSYLAADFVKKTLHPDPKFIAVISFLLVFVLVVLLVRLIAWALENILQSFSLGFINKFIGGIIHGLVGVYVFGVLLWFIQKWDVLPDEQKKSSHVYPYVVDMAPTVIEYSGRIVPMFKNAFRDFEVLLNK